MTSGFEAITGMDAMLAAIEQGKSRAEGGNSFAPGSALNYFTWKPGEKKVIRFLADDMITGDFYDFILDNRGEGKTSNFMADPTDPDRIKRYMSATPGIGWKQVYKSTKLEEPKPTKRGVCVAVLRQEVSDPERPGKTKIEDYLYDRDIGNGAVLPSRYFGIVQQGVNNFWRHIAAIYKRYGSIAVVDLEITREGNDRDTTYLPIPIETSMLTETQAVKDFYFYGQPWDENDEQRFLKCPQTTAQWAQKFSSEERYQRLLGSGGAPTVSPAGGSGGLGEFASATTHNDEAQAMRTSGTEFSSLADTLLKKAKG